MSAPRRCTACCRCKTAPQGVRAIGALALAAAGALMPAPAQADGLTVAVVDLREIPALAPRPAPEARQPAWRTTFGSERKTQPEIKTGIAATALAPIAGADVVLVQGVQANAPLRRLFPPRDWRLVVSRRILSSTDPVGFRTARADLPRTTAIAVKARGDLRITARALSLALHGGEMADEADSEGAAATAVRVSDGGGRSIWLASIALPPSCSIDDPPCPALGKLDAWRREKLESGEPTVIGGRMSASARATAENPDGKQELCTSHGIESDVTWEHVRGTGNSHDITNGCISIVRLSK